MKKVLTAIAALTFSVLPVLFLEAAVYKVTLTRTSDNLYKDSNSGVYFRTQFCYEYAYSDSAIYSPLR